MPSLFTELRRRNVFKAGAAYAIVAWLLVQVVDVVLPALQMPEWTISFVTVLLIIGFPITLIMAWAFEMTPEGIKADSDVPRDRITPATGQRLNYVILGLVVLAVGFLVVDQYVVMPGTTVGSANRSAPQNPPATLSPRYSINLGLTERMPISGVRAQIAFSQDSGRIVYAAQRDGAIQLYLRELDQLEPRPLAGTEGAIFPFFSPDGESVGFTNSEGSISTIPVRGGPHRTLSVGQRNGTGGFWSADDTILFTYFDLSLHRVAATGGQSVPLEGTRVAEQTYSWPQALPGGETILITVSGRNSATDGRIALLTVDSGEVRDLIQGGYNARYVPTGHIVFMRSASLWAVPFDLGQLEIVGPDVPVIQGIETSSDRGQAAYALSDAGRLVYLAGEDISVLETRNLVWVDQDGREELLGAPVRDYINPRLSPDAEQLAVAVYTADDSSNDLWIYDLKRDTLSRRTFTGGARRPIWTPDGEWLVYESDLEGYGLWRVKANGTGQPERITSERRDLRPEAFSPDGTQLVYRDNSDTFDLYVLSMEGERTEQPLIVTAFLEGFSAISPDGRWIAYTSDETGQNEVYVRPFPKVDDGKEQISTDGGEEPLWGPEGRGLFYRRASDNSVLAVEVDTEPSFTGGTPRLLFTGDYLGIGNRPSYDIASDGRFLMMKSAGAGLEPEFSESQQTSLVVIENWFEELNRLAPPSP